MGELGRQYSVTLVEELYEGMLLHPLECDDEMPQLFLLLYRLGKDNRIGGRSIEILQGCRVYSYPVFPSIGTGEEYFIA